MRALPLIALLAVPALAAKLTPATAEAFDNYVRDVDAQMQRSRTGADFMAARSANEKARMRSGEMVVFSPANAPQIKVPGGAIHDWLGEVFIPGGTISATRAVMQDYADYKNIYKPDILDSKLLSRDGDRFHVFLRLYATEFVTVVFNSDYDIVFGQPTPQRMWIDSHTTRIAEVRDPDKSMTDEYPVGDDDGYLWRMTTYWRFEQAGGGIWAE